MVIAEIIALARELCDRSREVHAGAWRKSAAASYEVRGKTLGVVGYGHIGRQVGVLAEAMGLRVVFYDVAQRLPMGNNQPRATLAEVLRESDFVTLHVPETPQTRGLVGAAELAMMRPGSYLLNASRGTVVDIDALVDALARRHVAGAAIDVFPEEPEQNLEGGFRSPLQGVPNVILTPHVGGSTAEAQQAIGREVATVLTKFVTTGATTGAVNFPQVELARPPGTHRILHIHRNVPGVLRDVNRIVAALNANIRAQILGTDAELGYLIMDVEKDVASAIAEGLAELETTIRTRSV
jgi:D-3-phosphoglycerate dehydrogenase / 2-oxoglutarate reductase